MVNVRAPEPCSGSASRLVAALRRAGGAGLLTALAVAPLAFGGTRPAAFWAVMTLVGLAAACWLASLPAGRRGAALPAGLLPGLALLLVSLLPWTGGWTEPTPEPAFTAEHFARVAARWPASVAGFDRASALVLPAGLGLALAMTADLARERFWLVAFAAVIALAATGIALLAVAQHLTHAPGMFWRDEGRLPGRFWGTFFHHTSAGAYLNTAWPLAAGLVALRVRGTWCFAIALVLLLAAHATHVSRFPQVAALTAGIGLLARMGWLRAPRPRLVLAGILGTSLLLGIATGRLGEIAERWGQVRPAAGAPQPVPPVAEWPRLVRADLLIPNRYQTGPAGDRGEAQQAALRSLADRPWTGHGPGNWRAAAAAHSGDPYVRTFYLYLQFAHQDFLQAGAERGLPGIGAVLLLLVPAAILPFFLNPVGAPAVLGVCAAAGLGAVLLQSLLDFPLQIPAVALNAHVLAGLAWAGLNPPPSPSS